MAFGFRPVFLQAVGNRPVEQVWVHVPCVGLGVNEYGSCPDISHGVGRRAEREALHHHLVVASHPRATSPRWRAAVPDDNATILFFHKQSSPRKVFGARSRE